MITNKDRVVEPEAGVTEISGYKASDDDPIGTSDIQLDIEDSDSIKGDSDDTKLCLGG